MTKAISNLILSNKYGISKQHMNWRSQYLMSTIITLNWVFCPKDMFFLFFFFKYTANILIVSSWEVQ